MGNRFPQPEFPYNKKNLCKGGTGCCQKYITQESKQVSFILETAFKHCECLQWPSHCHSKRRARAPAVQLSLRARGERVWMASGAITRCKAPATFVPHEQEPERPRHCCECEGGPGAALAVEVAQIPRDLRKSYGEATSFLLSHKAGEKVWSSEMPHVPLSGRGAVRRPSANTGPGTCWQCYLYTVVEK